MVFGTFIDIGIGPTYNNIHVMFFVLSLFHTCIFQDIIPLIDYSCVWIILYIVVNHQHSFAIIFSFIFIYFTILLLYHIDKQ